jgi:hypothetical protein
LLLVVVMCGFGLGGIAMLALLLKDAPDVGAILSAIGFAVALGTVGGYAAWNISCNVFAVYLIVYTLGLLAAVICHERRANPCFRREEVR